MSKIKIDNNFPDDLEILVSTFPGGLYVVNKNNHYNLVKTRAFGITYNFKKHIWVACAGSKDANTYFYEISGKTANNVCVLESINGNRVHQIDYIGNLLYITVATKPKSEVFVLDEKYKIVDKFVAGWDNAHLNSIFEFGGMINIIAHNRTAKTGRKSDLIRLDKNHNVKEIKKSIGRSCHNYYTNGKTELWCNSHGNSIIKNGKMFKEFVITEFIRGLSVSEKYLIVGSTMLNKDKGLRSDGAGKVYIYTNSGKHISTVILKKSQIRDIRQKSHLDLTISNSKYNKGY